MIITSRWLFPVKSSADGLKLRDVVAVTRRFSSSPSKPPDLPGSMDNMTEHSRFFGTLAALFVLGAAVRVVPLAASNTVEHCIKLIDTDQAFFVETGLARLEYLFILEAARRKAVVDFDIFGKLVDVLEKAALNLDQSDSTVGLKHCPTWTKTQAAVIGCQALELLSVLTNVTTNEIDAVVYEELRSFRGNDRNASVVEVVEAFVAALPVDVDGAACPGKRFRDRLESFKNTLS
jgi:hypothetical protein